MSQSDDVKTYTDALYHGPIHPFDSSVQDFLDRNPLSAAQTYPSIFGAPTPEWDDIDTAGVGKNFGTGFFVQDQSTGIIYRCLDATPGAAIWKIVLQEEM